jgi:hypothetical protein
MRDCMLLQCTTEGVMNSTAGVQLVHSRAPATDGVSLAGGLAVSFALLSPHNCIVLAAANINT